MDLNVEKEGAQLIEAIDAVDEEMDLASEEDATIEDIEGAKTLAAELIDRYDELLKRLSPDEQRELQERIGHLLEQVKEKLTQLKEAPE
jgi:ElaB/YqjD/DUF883 family membrane-anchored ribosome-binding protein